MTRWQEEQEMGVKGDQSRPLSRCPEAQGLWFATPWTNQEKASTKTGAL